MASQLITCRDMIVTAIKAAQANMAYAGFDVAASHIPYQRIEDPITQAGKVWVIGQCVDDKDRKTRRDDTGQLIPLVTREIMVQIAYQQSNVLADDIPLLDTLCWLVEQLRDTVKNFDYCNPVNSGNPDFQPLWVRNESLKDENGVPFTYYKLREGNIFETYFVAYFTVPHQ